MGERICLCMVNYNQGQWLGRAIGSALESSVADDLEIVVVDSGSPEDGIESARREFAQVRYIEMQSNRGYSSGLNRGLAETDAPIVVCANADIEFRPESLAVLRDALLENEDAGGAAPRFVFGDGTPQPSVDAFPSMWAILRMALVPTTRTRPAPETGGPVTVDTVLGACIMYRRECLEEIGGYDEGIFLYYEEVDVHRRLLDAGHGLLLAPEAVVVHHAGQATGGATLQTVRQHLVSLFYYLRKHGGRSREALARGILAVGYLARLAVSVAALPLLVLWSLARGGRPTGLVTKYVSLVWCCMRGWRDTERGAEP